jgi:pyruvate dehydrogenase E2 component (dihydrolipoamide acetyltransferase)
MVQISIPKLGMTVDDVNILEWKAKEGDHVAQGDVILVIETQKTEWNVEAEASGYIHIVAAEGGKAKVGEVVGYIAKTQDELKKLQEEAPAGMPEGAVEDPGPQRNVRDDTPGKPVEAGPGGQDPGRRIKITPVARKMAEEHMLDVSQIQGTGPGGRITREDVQKVIDEQQEKTESQLKTAPVTESFQGKRVRETIHLKGMRKAIADHMYRSLSKTAQMTIMGEFDMTEAVKFRETLVKKEGVIGARIGFVDLLVFIIARTLRTHRDINCSLIGEELKIWEDINVGVAVAMGKDGLIVPVVKEADMKTLPEISREIKAHVEKAQTGKLSPDDVTGGTFTLTSLGRGGTSSFQTPILNEPESAILGTGPLSDKPVVRDGQIAIAPMMPYSLTFDHRSINGFGAEQFLATMQELLRTPALLLI